MTPPARTARMKLEQSVAPPGSISPPAVYEPAIHQMCSHTGRHCPRLRAVRLGPAATMADDPPRPASQLPLSTAQLREFVTHGCLVVNPPRSELPPGFHAAVADKLRDTLRGPALSRREFWESLPMTAETNAMLRSPRTPLSAAAGAPTTAECFGTAMCAGQ